MNAENDSEEAGNNLEPALSYSNSCIPTRSRDSGAGVNAASRVDTTFMTSDSLSELVWSPHDGLTLKSADCSFVEKKPYIFWDLGSSNMVLSPPQSITSRGTTSDKPIDEGNLIASPVAFHVEGEVGEGAGLVVSPGSSADVKPVFGSRHGYDAGASDNMDEMNVIGGSLVVHTDQKETTSTTGGKGPDSPNNIQISSTAKNGENNAGTENQKTKDFLSLRTNEPETGKAQIDPMSREHNKVMMANPSGKVGDLASGSHGLGLELAMASDVHGMKQCEGLDSPTPNLMPMGGRQKNLSFVFEDESKSEMKMDGSTSVPPREKLEYTAENDLQLLIGGDSSGKIGERIPGVKAVPSEASPTNSRTSPNRRKGKKKALSDGDVNERMSIDEDDSRDTVESCNSTGLFSTGKKRWSFEPQLIVGSKRVKKQIQESPDSASLVGQDSSFMNWISNMVKGINKTSQDVAPSLALTLVHPNHMHASHDQKITTYGRNNDPGSRNMGFQTIFQSLYCSNSREQETKKSNGNSPIRGSKEFVLATKVPSANITPIAFHGENDNFSKQCFLSNEKVNQSTNGNEAGPSAKPINSSANIAAAPEMSSKSGYYSYQNKTSCNFPCNNEKDGRNSSTSSLGKREMDGAERNDSDLPPEGKVSDNVGYRCSPLGSLWINRFNPKNPCPILSLDHCNQSTSNTIDCPTDCKMLMPAVDQKNSDAKECLTKDLVNIAGKELHTTREYPTDLVNAVGEKLQNYASNTESSFGFKRFHGHNDQKPAYKLNPILPSPKLKNSEAMASVFARRLDALKHIIPSNAKDDAAHLMTTCFYCGKSGHDLLVCSEITETERENLIRNISSYDGAEESPCVCIRCFQLDHWAISCPIASSTGQDQSEQGAALGNHFSPSMMQLIMGNKKCARILETRQRHNQAVDVGTSCDGKNSLDKHIALSSGDNVLKEKRITPLSNLTNEKFSGVPEGMFDAIRKLRLSRMDTLKWMNSHNSLLHLDGFFLRLRLGKWEEGLGGTGYHVAYITGEQREEPQGSKRPISVKIGGIRCLVESQYISNKDFLEDELKAWWRATMESGGKIPSEDQLRSKIEERRRLGI